MATKSILIRGGIVTIGVVTTAAISAATVFFLLMRFEVGSRIASRMTRDAFTHVRPRMNKKDVLAVVGAPLWEYHYYGEGVGRQLAHEPSETVWQYASPGFIDNGFAAYVTFDGELVTSTEIKHNDFTVYTCSAWKCPNLIGDAKVLERLPVSTRGS